MESVDLLTELRALGALQSGHFLLASGRHSDQYVEKFDLLRRPRSTEAVCRGFTAQFRDAGVEVVIGPTTGGILLAFEVARQLGVDAAYAERAADGGSAREIKRGTVFAPGTTALVIDDILTTGGSIRETLRALAALPVDVVAVAVLVDRSAGSIDFGVPLVALATLNIATWDAGACPMCAAAVPLTKPGSTAIEAMMDQN